VTREKRRAVRKRQVWTDDDTEALRYWHGCKLTDGRMAKKLGCCRRTVLRQREAVGLRAVDRTCMAEKGRRVRHDDRLQ